jgi:hypothetical protein
MHDSSNRSARRLAIVVLAVGLVVSACSGTASSTGEATSGVAEPAGGESPAPAGGESAAPAPGDGGGSTGETAVTGEFVSSGAYDATWTWQPDNAVNVGIGGVTVNSDKGTFGNIQVLEDGSITFSTGALEISAGSPFTGTGAQVHMKGASGIQLPCGWTLDNDVTGSDGTILHLKGSMDVSGTAFACP